MVIEGSVKTNIESGNPLPHRRFLTSFRPMPPLVTDPAIPASAPRVGLRPDPAGLDLVLAGDWVIGAPAEGVDEALAAVEALRGGARLRFDAAEVGRWDSTFLTALLRFRDAARERDVVVAPEGLPDGARRLLALAEAVPERTDAMRSVEKHDFVRRLGERSFDTWDTGWDFIAFVGEVAMSLARWVRGHAQVRARDLALYLQQAGPEALGVVSLTNFLLGLILAFVGAAQLEEFGATIYVANLVGIAMVRDMAAVMTAIVLAGRSGAAYAAAIGTMQTNQEIDALRVTGISVVDSLVLPRVVALLVMTPLLTLYADVVGVAGGSLVASTMFDISPLQFFTQARAAVLLKFFWGGLFKGLVYGGLVAMAGCWHGLRCGRSAAAVGRATTSAVVLSIILIISAAGVFAYVFNVLGL
jgi:phospholipid/cholesterol/gamma-HCH transport system permease protein